MKFPKLSIAALFLALAAMVAVPDNAQAQEQEQTHYDELIGAIETMDEQLVALEQAPVAQVEVVDVGDMKATLDDEQREALEDARRDADTDALHAALSEQTPVVTALGDQDVTVGDVVAVNVHDEGHLVVYYDSNNY